MKRIVWFLLSFGLLSVAHADDATAKKLMEKGKKLFDQAKYQDAIPVYQDALKEAPAASGPFRELGRVYQQLNQFDDSIANFTEYLKRRPDAPERDAITKAFPDMRSKLPKDGRAFISVSAPAGAAVFVLTDGQARGIGVAPIEKHPVALGPQKLSILVPSLAPIELPLAMIVGKESVATVLSAGEAKINNPLIEKPTEPVEVKTLPAVEKPKEPTVDVPKAPPPSKNTGAKVLLAVGGAGLAAGLAANVIINQDSRASVAAINRISAIQIEREDPNLTQEQLEALNAESAALSDQLDTINARNKPLTIAMFAGLGVGVAAGTAGVVLLSRGKKQQRAQNIFISPTTNGILVRASF